MAVIGSIQDGIYGDHSTLVAKAILDFIIVLIMTSSMGKGCVFSFIPVAVLQGSMTALAVVLSGFMTDAGKYSDFLCGHQLGLAQDHQGGKPAPVSAGRHRDDAGLNGRKKNAFLFRKTMVN